VKLLPGGVAGLAWTGKRGLIKLRWPGLLGLTLLVFALAFYAFGTAPMRARLAALETQRADLAARIGARGPSTQPTTQRSQLSNFYAFFPLTRALPDLLGSIERAAKSNRLQLDKGEYRLSLEHGFPLARYQVTLPVQGSYGEVRGFVNAVLDAVPAAALEELALKREEIGEPLVEAHVRFVLFLGAE
jgi:Tfp pilus assembly protein PilO